MHRCNFCGNGLDLNLTIKSEYTSSFPLQRMSSFHQELVKCPSCNVYQFATDSPFKVLGNLRGDLIYKEPSSHYNTVAESFLHSIECNKPISIYKVSQKDDNLASVLRRKIPNSTIISQYLSQVNLSEVSIRSSDIILCNRFIEHINAYKYFFQLMDLMAKSKCYCYFEILDFEALCRDGNFSFIWNERLNYPTQNQVSTLLISFGLNVSQHHFEFTNNEEPFLSYLCTSTEIANSNLNTNKSLANQHISFDLDLFSDLLQKKLLSYFTRINSVAFYGIGNKALQMSLYLDSLFPELSQYFFDGDPTKIGTIWLSNKISDFSISCPAVDIYIFSFNNSLSASLIESIVSTRSDARIEYLTDLFSVKLL